MSPLVTRRQRRRLAVGAVAVTAALSATLTAAPPATAVPQDDLDVDVRAEQWWLDTLGAETIWEQHTRGEGVVVAVVDDGVDPGGDLEGAVLPGFTETGLGRGDVRTDEDYHGTTMATEIAGRGTGPGLLGMAPEATILPVKIAANTDVTVALETLSAMDDPPEVVNMSFNGGRECPPELQAAVRQAVDKGMILVASAGNNGLSQTRPSYPAGCAGVVAVGAYGFYGNIGDRPDLRVWEQSEKPPYLSLVAPGVDMIAFAPGSTTPEYFAGTSDAAAIASGSFALVRAAFPDMPSRELVARVLATARPLDGAESNNGVRDDAWGFGTVRPRVAIEEQVPANAPNPVYDALDEALPPADGGATPDQESGGPTDEGPGTSGDRPGADASGAESDDSSVVLIAAVAGGLLLLVVVAVGIGIASSRRGRRAQAGTGWPT